MACTESSSCCKEQLSTHPIQKDYVCRYHICLKTQVGMQQFCLLLWGLTPPFYFLLKDSRSQHLHRYHNDHVNSQSQESQQHPQSDLASSQQVQAPNWKRKQIIFPCQDLQVMIKCLKNSQHVNQLHCMCLCVLTLSFVLLSDPLLFRRKHGCPRTTGKCFEEQHASWVL